MRGLGRRSAREFRACYWKCLQSVAHRAVVNRAIEKGGHGEDGAAQLAGNLLIDLIRARVELAHGIAIQHINERVLARPYREMACLPARIRDVHEQDSSA